MHVNDNNSTELGNAITLVVCNI